MVRRLLATRSKRNIAAPSFVLEVLLCGAFRGALFAESQLFPSRSVMEVQLTGFLISGLLRAEGPRTRHRLHSSLDLKAVSQGVPLKGFHLLAGLRGLGAPSVQIGMGAEIRFSELFCCHPPYATQRIALLLLFRRGWLSSDPQTQAGFHMPAHDNLARKTQQLQVRWGSFLFIFLSVSCHSLCLPRSLPASSSFSPLSL